MAGGLGLRSPGTFEIQAEQVSGARLHDADTIGDAPLRQHATRALRRSPFVGVHT
ncbi:hypothetical protein [Streptomyces sp. NPDC058632]|uniref:hypothetical protein n=1 Tax=Streptomyces sp. NPDC058632 TaxID=3346567 RepID=UPI00366368F5